jgi:hypothetical protein
MEDYIPEIEYDPNAKPKNLFATYRPRRRGASWKTHAALGHARNAARQGGPSIIYEFKNGKWEEIEKNVRNVACTICGQDYRKNGPHFVPEITDMKWADGATTRRTTNDAVVSAKTGNIISYIGWIGREERCAHHSCQEKMTFLSIPIKARLESCVGPDTAVDYDESERSECIWAGQEISVSLIVQDELGGEIMKSITMNGNDHYFNSIDNQKIDLTAGQYDSDFNIYVKTFSAERETLLKDFDTEYRYNVLRALFDMTEYNEEEED